MIEETKGRRWCAIYGAVLGAMVQNWHNDGQGGVPANEMWHFMQEAAAVADLEADVRIKKLNAGEEAP